VESRSIRVGTWNVEYAAGAEKNAARLERSLAADCDVLVLTETHDALALPAPYAAVSSDQRPTAAEGGRWVTIWSRLPIRQLETKDPVRTAVAEVAGSILVYGTVLPWHTDPGPSPDATAPARNWSEFMRVTPLQGAEWQALRDEHPDSVLIVAGDLNQSLGAAHYYGDHRGSAAPARLSASSGTDLLHGRRPLAPGPPAAPADRPRLRRGPCRPRPGGSGLARLGRGARGGKSAVRPLWGDRDAVRPQAV
jgi:hypothetical protein